ncbi:hypothetical protein D4764_16G0010090 [Takifugu flavidus]|uniref:Uncharacterized protein n=1 Tax=Takifugu flavidus TaxID=433684 RepID=A0A5C6NYB3_9TELE|nr:hypothetical protein D4764_16G0010090 [Takifugu flavidus]
MFVSSDLRKQFITGCGFGFFRHLPGGQRSEMTAEAMHQNIPAEASFPGLGNGAVLQCDNIQVFTL